MVQPINVTQSTIFMVQVFVDDNDSPLTILMVQHDVGPFLLVQHDGGTINYIGSFMMLLVIIRLLYLPFMEMSILLHLPYMEMSILLHSLSMEMSILLLVIITLLAIKLL